MRALATVENAINEEVANEEVDVMGDSESDDGDWGDDVLEVSAVFVRGLGNVRLLFIASSYAGCS